MRAVVYSGWLMVAIGAAIAAGAIAMGEPLFGVVMLGSLGGAGLFMVWLARGWDRQLESSDELYKYGRPANAIVRKVEDAKLEPAGIRTAKLTLQVTPRNESSYKARARVALPGGRIPTVGETVTIKFDPHSRRQFVLLEENFEVTDQVQQAGAQMQQAMQVMNQLAGPPKS